jgi:hypothetical protein
LNKLYTFFLVAAILALSSCLTRHYGPGQYQNDIQNMIKSYSKDSVKSRFYASGEILSQSGAAGTGNSNSWLANVYYSNTIPHFNFSYGALAFTGNYAKGMADTLVKPNNKKFYGYGFNGSTSFYLSGRNIDWRVIGADFVYTHESGEYLQFRRSVYRLPNVLSAPEADMFTYAIFTEFSWKPNRNFNIGYKMFYTKVTGTINRDLHNLPGPTTVGSTAIIGYRQFSMQLTTSLGTGLNPSGGVQFGLIYGF